MRCGGATMLWLYAFIAVSGTWVMLRVLGDERQKRRHVLASDQRARLHHEQKRQREQARG